MYTKYNGFELLKRNNLMELMTRYRYEWEIYDKRQCGNSTALPHKILMRYYRLSSNTHCTQTPPPEFR